jgi:hypothetical protein
MELTLYDCSITISNSSHNSADACSHLFLSSIRHKLESKLETLDTQSPNHPINHDRATGTMRTQKHKFWLQISSPQMTVHSSWIKHEQHKYLMCKNPVNYLVHQGRG